MPDHDEGPAPRPVRGHAAHELRGVVVAALAVAGQVAAAPVGA